MSVIRFPGMTKLDIPPDDILEMAKGQYERVVVIGVREDDMVEIAMSDPSLVFAMFDLDRAKWMMTREVVE